MDTALGDALRRTGLVAGSRIYTAIAGLLKAARLDRGKVERDLWDRLHSDVDLRKSVMSLLVETVAGDMTGMPGEGQRSSNDVQWQPADARQPNGGGEVIGLVPQGQPGPSDPSPTESERLAAMLLPTEADREQPAVRPLLREGRRSLAGGAVVPVPTRKPNPPRGATVIAAAAEPIARSLFDTYRLPDGSRIGDIRWGSLIRLAQEHAEASRLLALLAEHGQADPDARVRDVIAETTLHDFVRIARLRNAA